MALTVYGEVVEPLPSMVMPPPATTVQVHRRLFPQQLATGHSSRDVLARAPACLRGGSGAHQDQPIFCHRRVVDGWIPESDSDP